MLGSSEFTGLRRDATEIMAVRDCKTQVCSKLRKIDNTGRDNKVSKVVARDGERLEEFPSVGKGRPYINTAM